MTLKERISADMTKALRHKNPTRLVILRGLLAEIQVKEKEHTVGTILTEEQVLSVLTRQKKQYEEALGFARQAQRKDLELANIFALEVLGEFLPQQLTEAEVSTLIIGILENEGPFTINSMGQVMKLLTPQIKGSFDGKRASELVKSLLATHTR